MKEGNRPRNMRSTKNGSLCTGHFPEPALLKHPSQTRLGRQNLMDFLGKSELLEQWSSLEVFAPPCVLCCQSPCENGIGTKSRMISSTSAPCLCPELRAGGECWIWWQGQTPGLVLGTVPRAPSLCCPPLPSPSPHPAPPDVHCAFVWGHNHIYKYLQTLWLLSGDRPEVTCHLLLCTDRKFSKGTISQLQFPPGAVFSTGVYVPSSFPVFVN